MGKELTVLKLGGALITDKSVPYTARIDVLNAAAQEIKDCLDEDLIQSLILVQGVGSYGHPPVLEHKLHKGFQSPEQLLPLSKTQSKVAELRAMVVEAFQNVGIPICLMYPSSMITSEKMRMTSYFLEPLKGFLKLGMVPLVGGDILIDSVMGWSVGSGDPLSVLLAEELGAKRLIFASDVSGIYDADPHETPAAKLFDEINLNELENVLERIRASSASDASGVMEGKIKSIAMARNLIESGLEVSIFSMMESGNLKALLQGDKSNSTQFIVK
jgi:isopentenyl phosphate kinase